MYKESLFELIRKEEVIIWAGAGLSLYAGYPSGQKLGEILVESLSTQERDNIKTSLPLPDLAEEFCRLKNNNRNSLIGILNQIFLNQVPLSTSCHQSLAIIPHFKTIITTNYDTLFEDSFKQKGQIVYSSKNIPYLKNDKTQIFKVHGDLKEPDSIIITKSDYNNFFKLNSENDIYWTVIKERLSTKSVLFLGYNIEDPNVSVIFDRITDALGNNRKECFLVAPNLPKHIENNLLLKRINYINSTAEEFISELLLNLKENIISDIEKGQTSADTFRHFLNNIDLLPELKADKESYKVKSIKGANVDVKGKMNLTIKNHPDFIKDFNDFVTGKKFGTFEVPEEKLINVDFSYGGIKFPNPEGICKLEFKSTPKLITTIDIRFEDGFELTDIPIKLYGSISIIEIHIELKTADLVINLDLDTIPNIDVKFNYKHKEICNTVKDEIELFTLLKNIGEGREFTIYNKSGKLFTKSITKMELLLNEADPLLDYFICLSAIEKHFKVRFSNINFHSITDTVINKVGLVMSVIKEEKIEYEWDDELTFDLQYLSAEPIAQLKNLNEINAPITAHHTEEEKIEIHGCELNLGYKTVEFPESYVANLESIIAGKEQIVRLKSRCKKMIVSYSKDLDEKNNL